MEPVDWREDGTPFSARFSDIYRTQAGGLAQSRQIFLQGCGLPQAWRGQSQWRILETGFGLGLNFLAAWQAWRDDHERCRLLHFASIEAYPVAAQDIVRGAANWPELAPLAEQLAAQWRSLETSGVHRFSFEQGRVLLTLYIGDVREMLREPVHAFDSIFLDGFSPQSNAEMWSLDVLKAVSRLAYRMDGRSSALSSWTASGEVRRHLAQCGWQVEKVPGLPPKRHSMRATFQPSWTPKGQRPAAGSSPGRCAVIGAGLAGAAAAASFARRGWQVVVLDAANEPAQGASALPVGLFAPVATPDDNLLSRLTRAGIRQTVQVARELLRAGQDWELTGVLDKGHEPPRLHAQAGWLQPAALVRAWLGQEGIAWCGGARVAKLEKSGEVWRVQGEAGLVLAEAELVVVAAAHASAELLRGHADVMLTPVRGQISFGVHARGDEFPATPVNGKGHFIPGVQRGKETLWFCGSTYGRGDTDATLRAADHEANLGKLRELLPDVAEQLAPRFVQGEVLGWSRIRCTSRDRRPLVGEVAPGLCVLTALGSRGITFAALSAELLAAHWHAEPLPLPRRLADALNVTRIFSAGVL